MRPGAGTKSLESFYGWIKEKQKLRQPHIMIDGVIALTSPLGPRAIVAFSPTD